MVPSLEKTKCGRKAIKDMESISSVDGVMDSKVLMIGEISIFLNCSTVSLTLSTIFKLKKKKEDLVEIEGKHPTKEEGVGHGGVTIGSSKKCRSQKSFSYNVVNCFH